MERRLNFKFISFASIYLQTGEIHKLKQWHQHQHNKLQSNFQGKNNNHLTCMCGLNFRILVLASQGGSLQNLTQIDIYFTGNPSENVGSWKDIYT